MQEEQSSQVAIGKSPDHQLLIGSAEEFGLSKLWVRDFLWRIRAPRKLPALPYIASRILRVIESAEQTWNVNFYDFGIEHWPEVARYVVDNRNELGRGMDPEFRWSPRTADHNPFTRHYLTYWAPYPSFWHSHASEDDRYVLLQAHLMFAFSRDARRFTSMADYEECRYQHFELDCHNPYDASHAVRILSSDHTQIQTLRDFPVDKPPFAFAHWLNNLRDEKTELSRQWTDLRNYLELVYDLRDERASGSTGGVGGGEVISGHVSIDAETWRTSELIADPDDPRSSQVSYVAVASSTLTPAESRKYVALDICPAEFESETESVETDLGHEEALTDPSSFSTIIGGAANHIERANQLLWFSYDVPTPQEVALVIEQWFRIVRSASRRLDASNILTLESIMIGLIMLATGATVEKASELHVYSATPPPKDEDQRDELALILESTNTRAWWSIKAPLPHYETQQEIRKDIDRSVVGLVNLPDFAHVGYLVRLLNRLRPRTANVSQETSRFFAKPSRTYARMLRRLLPLADRTRRTTLAKLSNFVFAHLVREANGDVADACFASAHWHDLARVPTFYATPSLVRIQGIHLRVSNHLGCAVRAAIRKHIRVRTGATVPTEPSNGRETGNPSNGLAAVVSRVDGGTGLRMRDQLTRRGARSAAIAITETDERIGNRQCPERDFVRRAVKRIKDEIRELKKSHRPSDQIRRHNLYSLFTIEFFAASVGIRAVTTPYLSLDRVDRLTGFAILSEKTIRPVWLPPETLKQMEYYDEYLQAQELICPRPTFDNVSPAPCFLIGNEGKAIEITPTVKTEFLHEYFPFAANIFRRFILSELRNNDCPAAVAKAWMSHASRGEEIFHKYSTFSLGSYRQALRHHLVPILKDLGFRPFEIL